MNPATPEQPPCRAKMQSASPLTRWGKRAGIFAFMFFFIKGLAWLVVPVALATWWAK